MSQLLSPLPLLPAPQVAFIGRSNAGKSSLIAALLDDSKMVKSSKHPVIHPFIEESRLAPVTSFFSLLLSQGHTQALNFFQVGHSFILVDMPGYGHRCRPQWLHLILKYTKVRER